MISPYSGGMCKCVILAEEAYETKYVFTEATAGKQPFKAAGKGPEIAHIVYDAGAGHESEV